MRISLFHFHRVRWIRPVLLSVALLSSAAGVRAADEPWKELQEQNRLLRAQLESQQRQLDELRAQVQQLAGKAALASQPAEAGSLAKHESTSPSAAPSPSEKRDSASSSNDSAPGESSWTSHDSSDHKFVLSGEFGLAFFSEGKDGQYRNDEFRVDDAFLRFDASLAKNSYFFGELQLGRREALDEYFHFGEFYLEFENVSGTFGGPDRLVNVRFGRVDIPFGEEYQHRNPLENPLVTHSLSDVWGVDEGIEMYGEFGRASYAFAVQNGSSKTMRDYNADKALTLRVGYDVTSQLHLSASAYRTGKLNSANEPVSEVWLGNNVFRNIGSAASTTHQAELAELDAGYTWKQGHVVAAAGRARYRDNDPLADNTQHFTYYQLEGVQSLTRQIYGAIRLSSLRVDHGYPLTGIGSLNKYFLGSLRTKNLERLSLGGGYRFNRSLVLKFDYTLEDGELSTGGDRNNHMFSFESALGF